MGGEAGVGQILVEGEKLARGQHALVDDDLAGQAAGVQQLALAQGTVIAQGVGEALADDVERALEGVRPKPFGGGDEQLLDLGLGRLGRRADIGAFRIDRHRAPADKPLALLGDDPVDEAAAALAFVA